MYHIAAFSLATTTNAGNVVIPAVQDQVLTISGSGFRIINQMNLMGAAAISPTAVRSRLDSPTLRILGNPFILPVNPAAQPVDRAKWLDLSNNPYPLPMREEIDLQLTISAVGPEVSNGLIWIQDVKDPIPPGRVQWVHATSTGAAVANTWTSVNFTFDTSLPVGWYALVGSFVQSTTAVAHRWIFPGSYWRPGLLSAPTETFMPQSWALNGALGQMGRFLNDNPLQLQVYCTAADASHQIYLGLVPVPGP